LVRVPVARSGVRGPEMRTYVAVERWKLGWIVLLSVKEGRPGGGA